MVILPKSTVLLKNKRQWRPKKATRFLRPEFWWSHTWLEAYRINVITERQRCDVVAVCVSADVGTKSSGWQSAQSSADKVQRQETHMYTTAYIYYASHEQWWEQHSQITGGVLVHSDHLPLTRIAFNNLDHHYNTAWHSQITGKVECTDCLPLTVTLSNNMNSSSWLFTSIACHSVNYIWCAFTNWKWQWSEGKPPLHSLVHWTTIFTGVWKWSPQFRVPWQQSLGFR